MGLAEAKRLLSWFEGSASPTSLVQIFDTVSSTMAKITVKQEKAPAHHGSAKPTLGVKRPAARSGSPSIVPRHALVTESAQSSTEAARDVKKRTPTGSVPIPQFCHAKSRMHPEQRRSPARSSPPTDPHAKGTQAGKQKLSEVRKAPPPTTGVGKTSTSPVTTKVERLSLPHRTQPPWLTNFAITQKLQEVRRWTQQVVGRKTSAGDPPHLAHRSLSQPIL
jgi:hypothetical protein